MPTEPHDGHHHTDGHCPKCGSARLVERRIGLNDRMYATVLPILAKQMGLNAYYKGNKRSNTLWVAAPDDAALDRFEARALDLMTKLEVQLNAVTVAFVKEHLGVELKVRGA